MRNADDVERNLLRDLIDRSLGNVEEYRLEHRCYNGVCLAAGFGCIVSSIIDSFSGMPSVVSLATFVVGLVFLSLYFFGRGNREYRPIFWLYILIGAILLATIWIFVDGVNGPGLVVSMVALVALTVVLKGNRLIVVLSCFFPLMTVLFLIEFFRPDLITPYRSETLQVADLFFAFTISMVVIFAIISMILNSYDRERKRLDNAKKELEEKNEDLNRANAELEDALERVETLSGMLPICAACKKVRDDQGYWNQIETYIRKHSKASFTHGICPDCAKKYYPEFDLNRDKSPEPDGA